MNSVVRRIAVSGSAAAALLGGAAAITVATPDTASAVELQARITHATGAPVTLPDGRTMRVPGLDTAGHHATPAQQSTVVTIAASSGDPDPSGIVTGITPDGGAGSALQGPNSPQQQAPIGYPQQIQTQAGGGAIGIGIVSILILAIIVFVKVKHSGLKPVDATIGVLFGIALSGTVIGAMGSQLTNSLVGSLGTMLGGLG
ncbi:hypothetical protein ACIQPQ_31330 [Streptomyces sp. NPDC091281]|uniref:hypothetical protein n=1 Tax=Streptomyces sp. NPDC091281 TaxID=3365985 RepID=UPI00381DC8F0